MIAVELQVPGEQAARSKQDPGRWQGSDKTKSTVAATADGSLDPIEQCSIRSSTAQQHTRSTRYYVLRRRVN
jgi:hypothetical protein